MTRFTQEQTAVLRQLKEIWFSRPCCLIGASALACHLDHYWRKTYDLDISVSVSVDELSSGMKKLENWHQHSKREHQWQGPGGVIVDILPAGPKPLRNGYVTWPKSGQQMNLLGFLLAFQHAQPMQLGPELDFHVAPLDVIALLKMVSYLDRPYERERDLQDLAYIFEEYLQPDDPTRFDDAVLEANVTYQQSSAFVLGRDLAGMVNEQERTVISHFIKRTRNTGDLSATQARMLRLGPTAWEENPEELLARIDALELGLTSRV